MRGTKAKLLRKAAKTRSDYKRLKWLYKHDPVNRRKFNSGLSRG